MNKLRNLAVVIFLAGFFGMFFVLSTNAQSTVITSNQSELINTNCATLKLTLNQIHSSDALMRVNSGQAYETILTKLMKRFNDRVVSNSMNNDELKAVANNFETALNSFRNHYSTYEQQLSSTINIDCAAQPQAFYDSLMVAREARNQVHSDILGLKQILTSYSTTLDKFTIDNQSMIERASK